MADVSDGPLIERAKSFRPSRAVRRRLMQVVFTLVTLALFAETTAVILKLAGVNALSRFGG